MTIRDKTTLESNVNSALADNTSQAISAQDVRDNLIDTIDSLHGVYGLMTVVGNSSTQSITTTPARITAWSANGIANGTTPDHNTTNAIAVGTAGIYHVHFTADVSLVAGTYTLTIYVNTTAQSTMAWSNVAGGAFETTAAIVGLVTCVANDIISVYAVSSSGGGINIVVKNAQLTVHRIA